MHQFNTASIRAPARTGGAARAGAFLLFSGRSLQCRFFRPDYIRSNPCTISPLPIHLSRTWMNAQIRQGRRTRCPLRIARSLLIQHYGGCGMSMFVEVRRLTTIGILGGLAAAGMGYARADELVKIGHVAPLTGPNAEWGKDTENGARLAVEEINAKGLVIDGQKVTL